MTATSEHPQASPAAPVVTRRPTGGPVGEVMAVDDPWLRGEALLDLLVERLDSGEGWVSGSGTERWWFPSWFACRLVVDVVDGRSTLRVDTTALTGVDDLSPELLSRLNDANVHAVGWTWWYDGGTCEVVASIRVETEQRDWSAVMALLDLLPLYATAIDSLAPLMVAPGTGDLCCIPHPERGLRPTVDGWLLGVRLGDRDPRASAGLVLTPREERQLAASLEVMCHPYVRAVGPGISFTLCDDDGDPAIRVGQVWHPQHGWGVQVTSLTGLVMRDDDEASPNWALLRAAASCNTEWALCAAPAADGAYVATGIGLVQHLFIRAVAVEQVGHEAPETFGEALAVLARAGARQRDIGEQRSRWASAELSVLRLDDDVVASVLSSVYGHHGPVDWSLYEDQREAAEEPSEWLRPRHGQIACFGVFSRVDPEVRSLEVTFGWEEGERVASLVLVVRHPRSPRLRDLGRVPVDELEDLVRAALSDPRSGVLGVGPHWWRTTAPDYRDTVVEGLRAYAAAVGAGHRFFTETAAALRWAGDYPWALLHPCWTSSEVEGLPDAEDPVGEWVLALTDERNVTGNLLHLRSVWQRAEGADSAGCVSERAGRWVEHEISIALQRLQGPLDLFQADTAEGLDGSSSASSFEW